MMGIFKNKKLLHELSKSVGSLEERFEEFVEGEETRGEISNNIYGVKRDVESLQAQIKSLEATMHNKDCLVELLLNLNERDYRLIPQAGAVYDPEDVPSKNRAKALEEGFEYVKPIGKLGELWVKKGKKEAVKEDKKDDK